MFRRILVTTTALASLAFANGAMATLLTDTVTFTPTGTLSDASDLNAYGGQYVNFLEGSGDFVAWTHQFVFDPAYETIDSGVLSLTLRDDVGLFDFLEIGFGVDEAGDFGLGLITSGTYSFDVGLNALKDGSFSVLVASVVGDFFIDRSVLTIGYTPQGVPEPTTWALMLFGAGLLWLLARKRSVALDATPAI